MVRLFLVTSTNFETSRKFLQKNMCLIACTSPLYQNHIYTVLPSYLFGTVSQRYLRCWAAVLILPKVKNSHLSPCAFFLSQQILAPIVMFHLTSGGKFKYQGPGLGNFWGGFFLSPFPLHYGLPTLYFVVPKGGNKNVIDFNCRSCSTEAVSRSEM